jgi:hypothetical protein
LRHVTWLLVVVVFAGCGGGCGGDDAAEDPHSRWFSSPTQVVEGIMHAYQTRNDTLYADFLADDFRYYFEPQGADSVDILGWGKEEEVVATGNLFKTEDVEGLTYTLRIREELAASGSGRQDWMMVRIDGGEMVVSVRDKEPMQVILNRQEIILRPRNHPDRKWEIVEWHDYPELEEIGGE